MALLDFLDFEPAVDFVVPGGRPRLRFGGSCVAVVDSSSIAEEERGSARAEVESMTDDEAFSFSTCNIVGDIGSRCRGVVVGMSSVGINHERRHDAIRV